MAMVQYAWCGGKGIDDAKLISPCNVCDGDGYINVPDPPPKCGRCSDTEKVQDGFSREAAKCSGCYGTGWASLGGSGKHRSVGQTEAATCSILYALECSAEVVLQQTEVYHAQNHRFEKCDCMHNDFIVACSVLHKAL